MEHTRYYAHSDPSTDREQWHLLSRHLQETGSRAGAFLHSVGLSDFGQAAGLLHDLGKYTKEFQDRLAGDARRVNHSTAGAQVAMQLYPEGIAKVLAFCIAGHHAGLANGVNGKSTRALEERLREIGPILEPVWKQELNLPTSLKPKLPIRPRDRESSGFCTAFLIRMVFSALVDADFLDTEAWFEGLEKKQSLRGQHPSLEELRDRLGAFLKSIERKSSKSAVNSLRREVLSHARAKAQGGIGVFTLTVPTGGGKTLTSLAFALDHAIHHGLERVIFVIPYMNIIEQTAEVFRSALRGNGDEDPDFVIEHHSTFDEEKIDKREAKDKLRLAMENWDAPIIVTTAVQFFESLFANRPSHCRKLHNITNSVVILDEAQTLPIAHLAPCVAALDELARNYRTSIVLCTATQPALSEKQGFINGFQNPIELAPNPTNLYQELKRTKLWDQGQVDDALLAQEMKSSEQILCILNSRRHARELYELIEATDGAFHLTTLMCARHRREILKIVRKRLACSQPVRLVATSLVEAGVDLDFPIVWRAAAGLESVVQAAGRCNREGRMPEGDVHIFSPGNEEGHKPPPDVEQRAAVFRSVFRQHSSDPMSLDAINSYFNELYWVKGAEALDDKQILKSISDRTPTLDFPFESIARDFRLIENVMVPVIVPWRGLDGNDDTVRSLVAQLDWVERPGGLARKLQAWIVQIPQTARNSLVSAKAARIVRGSEFAQQFVVLENLDLYRNDIGLTWHDPTFRHTEGMLI